MRRLSACLLSQRLLHLLLYMEDRTRSRFECTGCQGSSASNKWWCHPLILIDAHHLFVVLPHTAEMTNAYFCSCEQYELRC
jgi:hypothetical protein